MKWTKKLQEQTSENSTSSWEPWTDVYSTWPKKSRIILLSSFQEFQGTHKWKTTTKDC